MKNFPFQKDGKTYWYSRAIVCVSAVFAKDTNEHIYVLANQRGTATNKEVGKWNLPVGFLDFNETCAQCASREVFEETGVKISPNVLKLYNINSNPEGETQDVGFRYYALLDKPVSEYPLTTRNMEKDEVLTAAWIDIQTLGSKTWAWNHLDLIQKFAKLLFGDDIFAK